VLPSSTIGTAGVAGSGLRLTGGEQTTLQQLMNRRVEIRGTFQNDPAAPAAAPSEAAGWMNGRTLRITSIRPVDGECPGGRDQ